MNRAATAAACLFAVTALVSACGQPRRDTPYTQEVALGDPDVARGQQLFMYNCNQCHPGGAGIRDDYRPELSPKSRSLTPT